MTSRQADLNSYCSPPLPVSLTLYGEGGGGGGEGGGNRGGGE